ncbi:tetratricopeptide repeat protein [Azotobacter chroococcum]|uniref:tetratricopeptide repeat protein n=1 Tax=Azotobacter chroococcum TaxID=353 RepID=UPI00103F80D0|nr:tetratricopeptide repeat protein [Azotobacter chroococcum]TBW11080.1 tetratricopeptide repeat protein [Azotobacter chroococcum]TBW37457.1 tetratricopeptide repeat protein [Azotobacter chroococcum]
MKWKEIVIGAVATLLVTILGGIGVYYWTKEPDAKKTEFLYYSINQVATFKGGTTNLGFNVARIHNDGGIPARQVVLTVQFPAATITDYSVESSSGLKPKTQTIDKQKAEFLFDVLVPSEAVTVSLLTSSPEVPKISLRSNDSLGKPDEEKQTTTSAKNRANKFAEYFIPVVGLLSIALAIPAFRVFRNSVYHSTTSKNNFAFLLLHQGLMKEAETILNDAIRLGEDGAFALSNLAVCKAKASQMSEALSLIRAARFYSSSKHEHAVVTFNEALVNLVTENKDEFFLKLKEAVEKSPKSIREYCDYSVHLTDVKSDLRYAETFQNA